MATSLFTIARFDSARRSASSAGSRIDTLPLEETAQGDHPVRQIDPAIELRSLTHFDNCKASPQMDHFALERRRGHKNCKNE
jgi:hypothetical protein